MFTNQNHFSPGGINVKWINLFQGFFNWLWSMLNKNCQSFFNISFLDHLFILGNSTGGWVARSEKQTWFSCLAMLFTLYLYHDSGHFSFHSAAIIAILWLQNTMKLKRRHGEFKQGYVWSESYTTTDILLPIVQCLLLETFFVWKICSWWDAFMTWNSTVQIEGKFIFFY